MRDEDMLNLINEAAIAHKNKDDVFANLSTSGKGSRSKQDIDAEMIYSMIESHLYHDATEDSESNNSNKEEDNLNNKV